MPYKDPQARKAWSSAYHAAHRDERVAYAAEYYATNRSALRDQQYEYNLTKRSKGDPVKGRQYHLMNKYGMTQDDYDAILVAQDGACAICGTSEPGGGNAYFHIDHDHETGAIRGLLCKSCNLGIGHARESVDILMAMAAYLLQDVNLLVTGQRGL